MFFIESESVSECQVGILINYQVIWNPSEHCLKNNLPSQKKNNNFSSESLPTIYKIVSQFHRNFYRDNFSGKWSKIPLSGVILCDPQKLLCMTEIRRAVVGPRPRAARSQVLLTIQILLIFPILLDIFDFAVV